MSFSITADDEHCICVRNIQLNNFYIYSPSIKRFHPYFELFYFREAHTMTVIYTITYVYIIHYINKIYI